MILNWKAITKVISAITVIIGAAMLVPAAVSLCYHEYFIARVYVSCAVPIIIAGILGIVLTPKADANEIMMRDGYFIVVFGWIWVSVLGAIPFMATGELPNFIDAFFESASGYTTTGSTLLSDVEVMSRGFLFWRSFNHWLGGMGILFMATVLLPRFGMGGSKIIRAESTGPVYESTDFSARKAAIKLYIVYVAVTVSMFVMLMFGGLNAYDAAIHMFGALGTGGFSSYNTSIGTFDSAYVDYVTSFFMLLCSINFTLVVMLFNRKAAKVFRDAELRCFLGIVVLTTAFVTFELYIHHSYDTFADDLRYGFFLVSSLASSSGYSTGTVGFWPPATKIALWFLMIIGGCAASTSGGIKVIRFVILIKIFKRNILKALHPHGVYHITVNGKILSEETVRGVLSYTMAYAVVTLLATVLLCFDGADLHTSITTSVSSLSNIGPDYWFSGQVMCFGLFSHFGKLVNVVLMMLGRLEFISIFSIFSKSFWDK